MDSKQHFGISTFIYRMLRHPSTGIRRDFDCGGWLAIGRSMQLCSKSHKDVKISRDELAEILHQAAGRRFEVDESGTRILAKTGADVDES